MKSYFLFFLPRTIDMASYTGNILFQLAEETTARRHFQKVDNSKLLSSSLYVDILIILSFFIPLIDEPIRESD